MIYENVALEAPIQQGDVFQNIPRVDYSLSELPVIDKDDKQRVTTWKELVNGNEAPVAAVLAMTAVHAIAITQNCDAARGRYLCMCEVGELAQMTNKTVPAEGKYRKWTEFINRQTRSDLRWFYLPADPSIGFQKRMVVDFRVVIPVPRLDLEALREFRVGRLTKVANEHFRESLAQFLRRYPYNEWYPFTKDEFEAYAKGCGEAVKPYRWQEDD